ncbi:STAS domain-containing protein [Leptospira sp. 96542]|nr:STAS domain-containing protein [Leptospira sp. 96542]
MFEFEIVQVSLSATIHLKGSLSLKDTSQLKAEIKNLLGTETTEIIFDFKHLSYLDSSGMSILLHTYTWGKEKGKTVRIINVSNEVKTIFAVANLLQTFSIS